jgi:hypothetical protein
VNFTRVALASLGATVAYFAFGFALFAALPAMKTEFMKYPNVFRSERDMKKVMPFGMVGILISIVVLAVVYAEIHPAGGDIASGAFFGVLIGIFSICIFVVHNYVNLNIGVALALYQGIAYFSQWVIAGTVIGLIYKPA